jgi:hypothetical protein
VVVIRVFHVRKDNGLLIEREVFAPWAGNVPIARVRWAMHQAWELGGAVRLVNT